MDQEDMKGCNMMKNAYLEPTYFLDHDHPAIIEKVKELTGGCKTEAEASQRIFLFVRDQIPYNMYAVCGNKEYYKASQILKAGNGYCIQKAILLTTLARAAGIPSRLVLVAIRNHLTPPEVVSLLGSNLFFPHGYSQILLDGHWVNIAATYDTPLCERIGAAVPDFDGKNDTLLPKTDLAGRRFIEYVDHHGTYDDMPWDYIVGKMPDYYDARWKDWFGDEPVSVLYKRSGAGIG
ncbi:MAG TPA: transglutaminase family protein [Syntrophomonadaceae bacterium]|nr:transglutaminase family protein [Syntrophomonadaceae bacterium]HRX22102.1 transglutaminase family protein [Syntrophomonadaceae bacterium]